MLKTNSCPSRFELIKKIDEESFAISDILLFLDTHPCDTDALCFYQEHMEKRLELMKLYAESYGPLTIDDAINSSHNTWLWAEQPFPWETEGGCR